MTRIAVLGAGSWGTTLAHLLACKGDEIRLWAYEAEVVEAAEVVAVTKRLLHSKRVLCRQSAGQTVLIFTLYWMKTLLYTM